MKEQRIEKRTNMDSKIFGVQILAQKETRPKLTGLSRTTFTHIIIQQPDELNTFKSTI